MHQKRLFLTWVAVLTAIVGAGCDRSREPAREGVSAPVGAAPRATQDGGGAKREVAGGAGQRNLAMGTGEARNPEPFTREQRLLDAVQRDDRATIERALELGVPVGTKDDLGRSALLLAASDANDLELIRWLHGKGAALDEPDVQARAAISFAAANGNLDIVTYLADNGVQIDRPDWLRRTPLFHAALGDHAHVVSFLLDRGAALDVADQFGDTPLIVACAKGNAATAEVLIAHGADAGAKDQEGRTARQRSAPGVEPCAKLGPA